MKSSTSLRTARVGHLRAKFRIAFAATARATRCTVRWLLASYLETTNGLPCLGYMHHYVTKPFCIAMLARLRPPRLPRPPRRYLPRQQALAAFVYRQYGWHDANYTRRDRHTTPGRLW